MRQSKESSATQAMDLTALREELYRQHAAAKFAEYCTAAELKAAFGMHAVTLARMKRVGLRPVNSGTRIEVFRVKDVKEIFDKPEAEALPNRKKKRPR